MTHLAPRILAKLSRPKFVHAVVLTRVAIGAFLLVGCVSEGAYNEVKSAHDREALARASVETALEEKEIEAKRLAEEAAELKTALARSKENSAELAEQSVRLEGERDMNALLVNQLRGELERMSEHLRTMATEHDFRSMERDKLGVELEEANSEVSRLGAQVEALLVESKEKIALEKQLTDTLTALTELRRAAAEEAAKAIVAKKSSKRSG